MLVQKATGFFGSWIVPTTMSWEWYKWWLHMEYKVCQSTEKTSRHV